VPSTQCACRTRPHSPHGQRHYLVTEGGQLEGRPGENAPVRTGSHLHGDGDLGVAPARGHRRVQGGATAGQVAQPRKLNVKNQRAPAKPAGAAWPRGASHSGGLEQHPICTGFPTARSCAASKVVALRNHQLRCATQLCYNGACLCASDICQRSTPRSYAATVPGLVTLNQCRAFVNASSSVSETHGVPRQCLVTPRHPEAQSLGQADNLRLLINAKNRSTIPS